MIGTILVALAVLAISLVGSVILTTPEWRDHSWGNRRDQSGGDPLLWQ